MSCFKFDKVKLICVFLTTVWISAAAQNYDIYNDLAEQSSDPSSYYAKVDQYRTAGTMSATEVEAALRTDIFNLMNTVPAKAGQYDITRFITNPTFDSNSGWTYTQSTSSSGSGWGWGWSQPTTTNDFEVKNGIAECYGKKKEVSISQTISNLPAGDYTLKVQGFYRNGEWKQALANYERGKDVVKASFYIGNQSSLIKSIFDDGCYMIKGKHHKSADVLAVVSGRGFPHSHYIDENNRSNSIKTPDLAKQTFDHGHYWNEVTVHHTGGNLAIGITLPADVPSDNWVACDNFRLYYGKAGAVTISDDPSLASTVQADMMANVVLKKHFNANELTPLAVPCNIPASYFKAVYGIGSLDEKTGTAILYPTDEVHANVPCFVVTNQNVDEIKVENTYVTAAQGDQFPVLWDGGVMYRVDGTTTWKTTTVSEVEKDASYFTSFEYTDPSNMNFTANIENFQARQFLENTDYSDPNATSVIGNYFKPAPPRLDIPHNIGIPLPVDKVVNATMKYGLKSNLSGAKTQMILDHSPHAYIPNLIPGNTYYFRVEAGSEVLTQGQFKVEGPVRMIYAPSINNIRDLGGWTVQGNKQVRYGFIYRGGEANGLHPSVAEDRQTLIDLGIAADVDLRSDNNYDSGNGQVGKCAFGFSSADYFFSSGCRDNQVSHLTNSTSKARFKNWFNFILNHIREGKAVYFHCVWGADRTGLTAVLLEGLLGLSQEQMNKEFELTSLSFAGLRPKGGTPGYGDHQALIEKIKTYAGATLRDKFDTYWTQEVGITQEQIEEFRSIMLVGPTESVNIGSLDVSTYYSTNALDFSLVKGVKAYIVSSYNSATGQVRLTCVKNIPANTGVIVKAEAGTYEIPVGESTTSIDNNMLKGVTTPTIMHKVDGQYTNFILAQKNGDVGFYYVKDGSTLAANKAYLPLPTASLNFGVGARLSIVFEEEENDDATAIQEVMEEAQPSIYNLNGQRLESLQRGINIVDGKKVLVK